MPITSLSGVINSLQPPVDILKNSGIQAIGRLYSPFYVGGMPSAAVAPTPGLAGAALTTYSGQIPFNNPISGNTYLGRLSVSSNFAGTLLLCDRLWHNSGLIGTSTGTTTINSVSFPARDSNQTISGETVMIGLEVTTVMGAGTPTFTMGYTSSSGVQTSATTAAVLASMPVGSFIPIPLNSGHTGVQQVRDWTQSATMTSGAYSLVAYRVLTRVDVLSNNMTYSVDALTAGFPRMFDNTVPFLLWLPSATTGPTISAQLIYAQG